MQRVRTTRHGYKLNADARTGIGARASQCKFAAPVTIAMAAARCAHTAAALAGATKLNFERTAGVRPYYVEEASAVGESRLSASARMGKKALL